MCADRAKEPAERYGYRNAIDALIKIYRSEGLSTFSRGLTPNIVRSVIMSKSLVKLFVLAKTHRVQMHLR